MPASARRLRRAQHREGLADAGGGAEEDPQPAAPRARLLGLDVREQLVGIGPRLDCHSELHHRVTSGVERQIQLEHVDARLAEHAERAAFGVLADERRDLGRGQAARSSDARDLILGRGDADVRIEAAARRGDEIDGHRRRLPGSAARSAATRSPTASASAGLKGPWFEPLETAPLYGIGPVADGRLQKYCGEENGWPSSREPTAWPSRSMTLPVAWLANASCPTSVTTAG